MEAMAKEKPPLIGRPPLDDAERLEVWPMRIRKGTRDDIAAIAARDGKTPVEWAREELERAVARAKKRSR